MIAALGARGEGLGLGVGGCSFRTCQVAPLKTVQRGLENNDGPITILSLGSGLVSGRQVWMGAKQRPT